MNKIIFPLFTLAALALPLLTLAQPDLSQYRHKNRLLLIFAPSRTDPRWQKQNTLLTGSAEGFQERGLLRFDYLEKGGEPGTVLRTRYGVKPGHFRALLIGKDGHVASEEAAPVSQHTLFEQIDRMPMRREEMRREGMRRRSGNG